MASLSLKHIYKVYDGGVRAVSDLNLEIEDKEFVVFVGPSGCGKSTTLRMIAGLEEITSGELYIGENFVNYTEPKERDIAMVFQNYALYPHMTVFNNMAFGLKLTKMPKDAIKEKVEAAARILDIEDLLERKPKALSGGQRQRVALGRAIVRNPKVFLLDEPLSNLDAKLRVTMRTEITKLHEKLQTTFIYVTHDQTEAMTMGDRIVVMKDGVVQQADTPNTLYNSPANLFVACFLGSPQMNIFKAKIVEEDGNLYALIGKSNKVLLPKDRTLRIVDRQGIVGKEVLLGIRPEDVHCEAELIAQHPESTIRGTIDVVEDLGNEKMVYVKVDGKDDYLIARVSSKLDFTPGQTGELYMATKHAHLFDVTTERTLMGVPDYNLISAKAVAENGQLVVRFGETQLVLPKELTRRIMDKTVVNSDITLAIPPSAVKLQAEEGCQAVKGKIEFFDEYQKFKEVYISVPGMERFLIAKCGTGEEVVAGKAAQLYVDMSQLQIFLDGERIIADHFDGNKTIGSIIAQEGTYAYNFTASDGSTNKATVKTAGEVFATCPENTAYCIDPKGISFVDLKAKKGEETEQTEKLSIVLQGYIIGLDEYGDSTIVTLAVNGVEGDTTFVAHNFRGHNLGDKIRIAVDLASVTVGEYIPLDEYIAKL